MVAQLVTATTGGMNKNNPLFSIVTPTFNRADYLGQMVEGVLKQSCKEWELIVVNDGGTDSTPQLMEYYTKKDKRIRYFPRQKNLGIAKTRNEGNSYAKGDWIVVCDSDDIWLPNRLKVLAEHIKKQPDVEFWYGGVLWMSNEGSMAREYWIPKPLTAKKLRAREQTVLHGSCAYKRWIAKEIGYRPEQKINDDFWFIVDCWNKKVKFGIINEPLMGYRILPDGVSRSHYWEIQKELKKKLKTEFIRED